MTNDVEIAPLRIGISGSSPATGSSTLSRSLAEYFGLGTNLVYAGRIRRAIAKHWSEFSNEQEFETLNFDQQQLVWNLFCGNYANNLVFANEMIQRYYDSAQDENMLLTFNQMVEDYRVNPFEVIPDIFTRHQFNQGSVVADGKLAVAIDCLVPKNQDSPELAQLLSQQPKELIIPYIRLLLTTDIETAAKRVVERERGKEAVNDSLLVHEYSQKINQRIKSDWERYSDSYTLLDPTDQKIIPLSKESLITLPNTQVIDTSEKDINETLRTAIGFIKETIFKTLNSYAADSPEYNKILPLLNYLNKAA